MPEGEERHGELVGLVGAGIRGSLSPSLHETEAAALSIPYRYNLIDLDDQDVGADGTAMLVRRAVDEGYTALNITHPCKQLVIDVLDEISADARALGAVNTITIRQGRLAGHNTDHSGFITGLRHGLPGVGLHRVAVIGAGGAGSATSYALLLAGARVLTVTDVDHERTAALCERLSAAFPDAAVTGGRVQDLPALLRRVDGVVNATPMGMVGHPGLPFEIADLQSRHWLADVVYRPLETELLGHARARGCRVLDGGAMLVAQAAGAFELITGVTPDLSRMRRQLRVLLAQP